jgi:hypothetical protein
MNEMEEKPQIIQNLNIEKSEAEIRIKLNHNIELFATT